MLITEEMFLKATGQLPEDDDLERCNCKDAGKFGHSCCGWNKKQNMPVFMVGKETKMTILITISAIVIIIAIADRYLDQIIAVLIDISSKGGEK